MSCDYDTIISSSIFFFKQTLGLYFSCVVSRQFNEFVLACAALHTMEAYAKGVAEECFCFFFPLLCHS